MNTVALAKQQAEFLSHNLTYDTSIYTSDRNVDAWKQDKWLEEFAKYQVIQLRSITVDVKINYL